MHAPSPLSTAPWRSLRDFFIAEALAGWSADRRGEKLPSGIEQLSRDEKIDLLCREHWFAESLWKRLELIEFFAHRAGLRAFACRERGDQRFAFADAEGSWSSADLDSAQAFEWLLRENGLGPERASGVGLGAANSSV